MAYYIGVDLGTTGLKSAVLDREGRILGLGYQKYSIETPMPNYAQQDPDTWWSALKSTMAQALMRAQVPSDEIRGIGLSGQMHGTVLLDKDKKLLGPAVIWCDQRAFKEADWIRTIVSPEELRSWIQNPVASGFQACTLLWLRMHQPQLFRGIRHVLLPKDYLRFRLTGEIASEVSDACSTALFNCAEGRWSEEMLSRLGLDPGLLPDACHLPYEAAGHLSRAAARELGLSDKTLVAFGGGDQSMQALGNGVIDPGRAMITMGTGGQILIPTDLPQADPSLCSHLFCHAEKNTWYALGAILNCCLAQNWFFDKVLESDDYAGMHGIASEVPAGSRGLLFLPYLTGERTPHMNPNAKGIFWGLELRHDRATMVRAVIEGISFALLDAWTSIGSARSRPGELILTGGGARSALWRQILADLFDRPIYTTNIDEAACVGAAICAMIALNEYPSLSDACSAIVQMTPCLIVPNAETAGIYREQYEKFHEVYQANKSLFRG